MSLGSSLWVIAIECECEELHVWSGLVLLIMVCATMSYIGLASSMFFKFWAIECGYEELHVGMCYWLCPYGSCKLNVGLCHWILVWRVTHVGLCCWLWVWWVECGSLPLNRPWRVACESVQLIMGLASSMWVFAILNVSLKSYMWACSVDNASDKLNMGLYHWMHGSAVRVSGLCCWLWVWKIECGSVLLKLDQVQLIMGLVSWIWDCAAEYRSDDF